MLNPLLPFHRPAQAEYFFIAFFTVEMVLKIVGMGFILERGTYMRDPWNIMDFLVVVLGLISMDPKAGNYTAIRAVRVLRPLRTITRVKGMRNLVITLLESLPMLLDVLVLCFFAFFIYGIIGYQMMAGRLQYRCAPAMADDGSPLKVPGLKNGAMEGTYEEFCSGPSFNETRFNETPFNEMTVLFETALGGMAPPETTSDMDFASAFGVKSELPILFPQFFSLFELCIPFSSTHKQGLIVLRSVMIPHRGNRPSVLRHRRLRLVPLNDCQPQLWDYSL